MSKLAPGSPLDFKLSDGTVINADVEYVDEHRMTLGIMMGLQPRGRDVLTLHVRFYIDQKDLERLAKHQNKYKDLTICHDGNAYSVEGLSCWSYYANRNMAGTTAIGYADCICFFSA